MSTLIGWVGGDSFKWVIANKKKKLKIEAYAADMVCF